MTLDPVVSSEGYRRFFPSPNHFIRVKVLLINRAIHYSLIVLSIKGSFQTKPGTILLYNSKKPNEEPLPSLFLTKLISWTNPSQMPPDLVESFWHEDHSLVHGIDL